jgi:hypothetical protein
MCTFVKVQMVRPVRGIIIVERVWILIGRASVRNAGEAVFVVISVIRLKYAKDISMLARYMIISK